MVTWTWGDSILLSDLRIDDRGELILVGIADLPYSLASMLVDCTRMMSITDDFDFFNLVSSIETMSILVQFSSVPLWC